MDLYEEGGSQPSDTNPPHWPGYQNCAIPNNKYVQVGQSQAHDHVAAARHSQKANDPGTKHDAGKPSLSLLDRQALEEVARVLDFGKLKYTAHNWRGGITWSRVIDSSLRHIHAFNDGEDIDPESGINHLAHAMCNLMFLLNYYKNHKDKDDRHKANDPNHTTTQQPWAWGGSTAGLIPPGTEIVGPQRRNRVWVDPEPPEPGTFRTDWGSPGPG